MSMLAEPRRKVKWTLNPRGNLWAEDETSYGQRMLRKMGWEKGKGLGKDEDGNKEHIKVTYKNDRKGIGVAGNDDDWIAHQDDFNAVLSSLNEQFSSSLPIDAKEPIVESLERKSKSSRSRVHYHKFIRGKDLTTYSRKDMAAIFGNKKKENEESNEDLKQDCCEASMVITYNSSQNIQEYFKQKMAALGKMKNTVTVDCNHNVPSREEDTLVSGKDIMQPNPKLPTNLNVKRSQENTVKKQKKRRSKMIDVDAEFCPSDSENSQAKLSKKRKEQFSDHSISEESLNLSVNSGSSKADAARTSPQEKSHSSETENTASHTINFPKMNECNVTNQFTESNKQDKSVMHGRRKQKRKLRASQESSNTRILVNGSVSSHNCSINNTEIPKGEDSLVNCKISSDDEAKDNSSKKTKKSKKNKKRKMTDKVYPDLKVHNAKTSLRCNALQQIKLYFGDFTNRKTLPLLKKYEELCENFHNSGLASSNLLSVHGYGNEFLLKDHVEL